MIAAFPRWKGRVAHARRRTAREAQEPRAAAYRNGARERRSTPRSVNPGELAGQSAYRNGRNERIIHDGHFGTRKSFTSAISVRGQTPVLRGCRRPVRAGRPARFAAPAGDPVIRCSASIGLNVHVPHFHLGLRLGNGRGDLEGAWLWVQSAFSFVAFISAERNAQKCDSGAGNQRPHRWKALRWREWVLEHMDHTTERKERDIKVLFSLCFNMEVGWPHLAAVVGETHRIQRIGDRGHRVREDAGDIRVCEGGHPLGDSRPSFRRGILRTED